MKGPITHVTYMHTDTHTHVSDGASAKRKTVFKLPGFIVQSNEIPFHVTNKCIRQAKRKRVGWKMSTATPKLLLISHARARRCSPPRRVTSEEREATLTAPDLFRRTLTSSSGFIGLARFTIQSRCWHKIKPDAQTSIVFSFRASLRESLVPSTNTVWTTCTRGKEALFLLDLSEEGAFWTEVCMCTHTQKHQRITFMTQAYLVLPSRLLNNSPVKIVEGFKEQQSGIPLAAQIGPRQGMDTQTIHT